DVENLNGSVIVINTNDKILYINDAAKEIFGENYQGLVGKDLKLIWNDYFNYKEDLINNFGTFELKNIIKNNPEIFGEQNIYNSKDEITGTLEKLLINASQYTIEDIFSIVKKYDGVMIPAHINKMTNGILGVLGFMPINLKIETVEVYSKMPINSKIAEKYKVIYNSDAHQLVDIAEAVNYFDLDDIEEIYEYLFE
ncbi:MAG TPA: PAS domain-containing protein, partial [Sedimentibacter sp.]|nr:PAS domain-containing protein [Sedimentibacter sp.]